MWRVTIQVIKDQISVKSICFLLVHIKLEYTRNIHHLQYTNTTPLPPQHTHTGGKYIKIPRSSQWFSYNGLLIFSPSFSDPAILEPFSTLLSEFFHCALLVLVTFLLWQHICPLPVHPLVNENFGTMVPPGSVLWTKSGGILFHHIYGK